MISIRTLLAGIAAIGLAGCALTKPLTHNQAGRVAEADLESREVDRKALADKNRNLRDTQDIPIMTAPPREGTGVVSEIDIAKAAAESLPSVSRGDAAPVRLEFVDASLKDIIVVFMRDYLKQPYHFQDSFKDRKVNLYFNATANRKELIQLFDTLLDSYGVRLRFAGGVYLVGAGEEKESKEKPSLPLQPSPLGVGDAVGLFRPRFIDAKDLLVLAKVAVKQPDRLYPMGNSLVVSSTSVDVRAVESLLRDVDVPGFANKHVLLYVPRYLSAGSLVAVLDSYQAQLSSGQPGSSKQFEAKQIPESERVVIVAANALSRDLVLQFLAQADVAGANQRRIFQYALGTQAAADVVTNVNSLIKAVFRNAAELTVVADKASNSLFIYATPDEFAEVRKLLARMDYRPPAVSIDIVVAEVNLTKQMKYGVEWYLKSSGRWLADLTTKMGVDSTAAVGAVLGLVAPNNTYATLQLIGNETSFSLLSNPKIVVKNGATAKIAVGREQPVIKQKTINQNSTNSTVVEPEFKKIGLELEVTPFVTQSNEVRMIIKLKDTSIVGSQILGSDQYPILANREIATDLVTGDGNTIFIGGIRKQESNDLSNKLPGLGDMPYIGALFRNNDISDSGQELIILATPTVIMDQQGADIVTQALLKAARLDFGDPRPGAARTKPE